MSEWTSFNRQLPPAGMRLNLLSPQGSQWLYGTDEGAIMSDHANLPFLRREGWSWRPAELPRPFQTYAEHLAAQPDPGPMPPGLPGEVYLGRHDGVPCFQVPEQIVPPEQMPGGLPEPDYADGHPYGDHQIRLCDCDAAMPCPNGKTGSGLRCIIRVKPMATMGTDLRDRMAMAALTGMLASDKGEDGITEDDMAGFVYDYADAMMAERAKRGAP